MNKSGKSGFYLRLNSQLIAFSLIAAVLLGVGSAVIQRLAPTATKHSVNDVSVELNDSTNDAGTEINGGINLVDRTRADEFKELFASRGAPIKLNYEEAADAKPVYEPEQARWVPDQTPPMTLYAISDHINVRTEPNRNSEIRMELDIGTPVQALVHGTMRSGAHSKIENWWQVQVMDVSGYIRADLLQEENPRPQALADPRIVVYKSALKLELYDGDWLVETYDVQLGKNDQGHKAYEGDGRTPEGTYYVCAMQPDADFYLGMLLSYPNTYDAAVALQAGRIDETLFSKIVEANRTYGIPPQLTSLGGQIMIHGGGSDREPTQGCIAVEDGIMDELFTYCRCNMPVTILP